jgi:hypothetical protein
MLKPCPWKSVEKGFYSRRHGAKKAKHAQLLIAVKVSEEFRVVTSVSQGVANTD